MNTRSILYFFAAMNFAAADMCQQFCLSELNPVMCARGSWCKNNYDCHNLFWNDASRRRICLLGSYPGCTPTYPVLCNEASQALRELYGPFEEETTATPATSTDEPTTETTTPEFYTTLERATTDATTVL